MVRLLIDASIADRLSSERSPNRSRLLHVVQSFAPGGIRTRILTFAAATADEFEHHVVALDDERAGVTDLDGLGIERLRVSKSWRLDLGNLFRLRVLLGNRRPDLLITHNWGTIEAALANRVKPVCSHLHWEVGFSGPFAGRPEPARRAFVRRLAIGPRSILCLPSESLRKVALERWRIPTERVKVIANGIDTARFAPAVYEGISHASGITVGTLARLGPEKNIGRLLKIFSRADLPAGSRLAIGGDGPERPALERSSAELSILDRTEFLGHISEPAPFLRTLDIFAITSDSEQMPFSLLEAMASGLPVIASDVGDVRSMLSPENRAFVVAATDEDELTRLLGVLANSAALRARLGRANAERVRIHFGQNGMIRQYKNLIHHMIALAFRS